MEILRTIVKSIFQSSRSPQHPADVPPPSFSQFSKLPIELRLKIWRIALEPRIVPLHLREYSDDNPQPDSTEGEERTDDSEDEMDQDTPSNSGRPPRCKVMCITTCSLDHTCRCNFLPPGSDHLVPPPALFSVCRESRQATLGDYSRIFDSVFNERGRAVPPPSFFLDPYRFAGVAQDPYDPSRTGAFINLAVDIPWIRFTIGQQQPVRQLHQFVTIASKEGENISKIALNLSIVLPPYQWWRGGRFEWWKGWGATGSWVPREVVKFRNLKEVILVVEGKVMSEMLPVEWRERTISVWEEELMAMRDRWPAEWQGIMPVLRFVTRTEDL
jgi:hypothetical protein